MPRFFDEAVLSDDQIEESEKCTCGGVSPEALYNDYKNRMPFHYVEDDTNDGYYFWSYGATMELEVELEGEIAVTNDV